MANYFIDQICKHHKISEYLAAQNVHPNRDSDGKLVYRCPLPNHSKDNTPSFYVYDKIDHEDFWCYGCKTGGGIIQMVSAMEQISIKDAISRLSNGLDFDISDSIDHVVRDIILSNQGVDNSVESVLQIVMYISTVCHDYLTKVKFDSKEVEICDKLFALCDNLMKSRDRKGLEELIELLPSHIGRRYSEWMVKKENEERDGIIGWRI